LSFTAFAAPQWHNQRNNSDKLTIEEWQKQPLKYKYNASYGFAAASKHLIINRLKMAKS
jgi:hypothetical protein